MSTVFSPALGLTSAATTLAPSWAKRIAVALPIPGNPGISLMDPAPAMRATFAFNLVFLPPVEEMRFFLHN